ncbi:hypothetical protein ACIHFE_33695 [Streptomyces sp. NPDC052396]|uniref:hypothetical protein n=1 Tax=Streptomyces sp. NPDC052396 TaxID=3365689 RepID=UPI0037D90E9C
MAEEQPQESAVPLIPKAPVLDPIEDRGSEEAAARADARADGLRALWNMGPAALGLPEDVHAAAGAALRAAGEQAAAEADQYRAQYAAEVGNILNNFLHEEELEPGLPTEAGPDAAAAVQLDADESRNAGYLTDYRAGRPPRDEAAAEAYREWQQLDAEDQEAASEALDLENEYERYQGALTWNEWLQQRDAPEFDSTEAIDDPSPEQPPQRSVDARAERGEETEPEATDDAPRSNAAAETAEVNEVVAPDGPRSAVEPRPAATAEDERAGTAQAPVETTVDVTVGEARAEDLQAPHNVIDALAVMAVANQLADDPGFVTFAHVMAALDQLPQSGAADRAVAASPQEPPAEPIAALNQGVAQLGTVVDPPDAPQPMPDLGLAGFEAVEQAYAAAAQHGQEYNGAREWRQLSALWQSSQRVWESARDVLRRSGARVADRVRGICRAVGIRVADGVARLSDRLAERLAKAGRDGSPGHRALRSLSQAAENSAARMGDRAENSAAFAQITDSLRDLRTGLARGTDVDGVHPDAPAGDQAPATADRDKDAYQLVNEAFGSASRHSREYNGASEWRHLTAMWPMAGRVLGEQRAAALARYGADLATDVRWQGAMRTVGVRALDTVARLSHGLAERLAKAGRYDSPGRRAIQDLGHTAQRAASTVRGDEAADRVAAFDRLTEAIHDLQADLAQVLDNGPSHGAGAAVPFGEPSRPLLAAGEGQRAETARPDAPRERPAAVSGGRNTGAGVGE